MTWDKKEIEEFLNRVSTEFGGSTCFTMSQWRHDFKNECDPIKCQLWVGKLVQHFDGSIEEIERQLTALRDEE